MSRLIDRSSVTKKRIVSVSWIGTDIVLRPLVVLLIFVLPLGSAHAESESLYARTGYYLQAGAAAGFFDAQESGVAFDPAFGSSVTVGYRINAYISGEIDFTYISDSDTDDFTKLDRLKLGEDDDTKTMKEYEVSFNLKGYPFGYFEVSSIPDWVQPYARIGIGFGEDKVGYLDETRFLLRFGTGLDFLITDQVGVYVDGGYTVITSPVREKNESILDGRGHLGFGAFFRF